MTTIYKLEKLKKIYNKTIIKLLKKDFIQKLKIIKNTSNDIIFCKVKNNLKRYSTTFNDNKTGNENNNNSDIKKVKTNIKRYSTNNFEIKDIKEDDIVSYNMKNNLKRYSTTLFKKDDNKTDKEKDIPSIKIVKTNIKRYSTNNVEIKDNEEIKNQNKIIEEEDENININNVNSKEKRSESLSKLINIKNKALNNLIKQYFNKWNKISNIIKNNDEAKIKKKNNIKKKKRIAKRHNFKKKNKKKNEIITVSSKIINNKELIRNIIYRWKNNAHKIKIIDDYKHILTKMKKNKENYEEILSQNNINKTAGDKKYGGINLDLFNKLKKVSLHLLLSIYQKSKDNIKKEFFSQWKSIIAIKKLKKKNRTLVREISKYIKKKVGSCFKKKEENEIVKRNKEKTFAKKKTKLNLYKERIAQYKNTFQPKYNNLNNIYTNNNNIINNYENGKYTLQNRITVNETIPENKRITNDNYILNILSNYNEPRYIIKRPGKRNLSQNRNNIKNLTDDYHIDEKDNRKYISKSGEKYNRFNKKNNNNINNLNSYIENLIAKTEFSSESPYNNNYMENLDEKANLYSNSLSSQEDSTSNHISLVQESNEIQRPKNSINLSIKNKKNYFSQNKTYNISHPNNYFLTDTRTYKNIYPQNILHNNQTMIPNYQANNIRNNYPIYNNNYNNNYINNLTEKKPNYNNIYLYSNEKDRINTFNGYGNYLNKPQYYQSSTYNDNNAFNNNLKKINPLYERMVKSKMNSQINNYNSPLTRQVLTDNNRIKIINNQNSEPYQLSESEEFNNNISNYENDTLRKNYNYKNMFY